MPRPTKLPEAAQAPLPKLVPPCGISAALQIAQSILEKEPQLFKLGGRHSGIIHAHSELWCAVHLGLDLPFTGVSAGADAWAKGDSVIPLKANDTVQIKARGSHKTWHITFKTKHKNRDLDWLVVMTYDLERGDITPKCFLMAVPELIDLLRQFANEQNGTFPLSWKEGSEDTFRVEWDGLFASHAKTGKVRDSPEKWEDRSKRARRVEKQMFLWNGQRFERYREAPSSAAT